MHDPSAPDPSVPLSEQATVDLPDERPTGPRWSWIIDRNPMFLISGVLILAGCFLVSQSIHELDPSEVEKGGVLRLLIGLLVVLNVYEFAVIGLGLALARTKTLVRDSRHLLGLALLLLIDAAFVYNETGIADLAVGGIIAGLATLLALLKAWLIIRSLHIKPSIPAIVVTSISLAAMYGLPIAVRALSPGGFLSQSEAMLIWGAVGVLVALYAVPGQWVRIGVANSADHRQLQHLVAGGLIVLPLVSLIGHAGAALWVYENAFEPSMLSPILLGFAAILLRHHRALGGARPTAQAATLIVASAIVASLIPANGLIYESSHFTWLAASPLRGVLLLAPALLGWAWWISGQRPIGLFNALMPLAAAALGHTPGAMIRHGRWVYDSLASYLLNLMPTGKLQWGALAIAAAFACLLAGGALSWWQRSRERARASISELLVK